MALRTDYQDDIFSGNRKYSEIDNGDGTISFTDETEYDQVGDTFGATQINEIDGKINTHDSNITSINQNITNINTSITNLNSELTAGSTKFYFDCQGGKWGWNSSPARGAGTFHPFKTDVTPAANQAYIRQYSETSSMSLNVRGRVIITGSLAIWKQVYDSGSRTFYVNLRGSNVLTLSAAFHSSDVEDKGDYKYGITSWYEYYPGDVVSLSSTGDNLRWHASCSMVVVPYA